MYTYFIHTAGSKYLYFVADGRLNICGYVKSFQAPRLFTKATRSSSTAQKKRICTVLHQHAIGKHIRWKPLK